MNQFERIPTNEEDQKREEAEKKIQKTRERFDKVVKDIEENLDWKLIKYVGGSDISRNVLKDERVKELCKKIRELESKSTPTLTVGKEGIGYTHKEEIDLLKGQLASLIEELSDSEKAA